MTETEQRIRRTLAEAFSPAELIVEDDSARHAGHAGARPGGGTHFNVTIVADAFAGLPLIARHRLVNDALRDEFADRLHALSIKARAPGEA